MTQTYDNTSVGFIMSIPMVLFAFDGFIVVSNLQSEAKSKNTFKLAMISGIAFISIIYIVVAVFSFLVGNGNYSVLGIIDVITNGSAVASSILMVIIFISGSTALNGMSMAGSRLFEDLSKEKIN